MAGGEATSEIWDKPDDAFESMVGRIVQHSLDQYADRVMGKEAEQLFRKALRLIVDTERKVQTVSRVSQSSTPVPDISIIFSKLLTYLGIEQLVVLPYPAICLSILNALSAHED